MFEKVLIANRGEIALRVLRACRGLGLKTVAVYSEADRGAPYLPLADQALCIGPPAPAQSYLNPAAILAAARDSGLDHKPAAKMTDIPVGGGSEGGAVWLDGRKVVLPAFPAEADAGRVRAVLSAITAAIPQRLKTSFLDGN